MLSINIDGLGNEPQFEGIALTVFEIEVSTSWQLYIYVLLTYIPECVHLHTYWYMHTCMHTDRQADGQTDRHACMPAYKQVNSTKAFRMVTIVYNKYTFQTCIASVFELSVMWVYEAWLQCWA